MKRITYLIFFASVLELFQLGAIAQPFTLAVAEQRARIHYPSIRQKDLVRQTAELSIGNLTKSSYPQLSFNSQLSYQSAVTEISIPNAPFKVEPLSKDQYRFNLDVSQLVYDGGALRNQKELSSLQSSVEQGRLEIEWQRIRERVQQLYCNILYTDALREQIATVLLDIDNGIRKVEAQLDAGTVLRSSLEVLRAEKLKTEQRLIEIDASRTSLIQVLGIYTDTSLTAAARFVSPEIISGNDGGLDSLQRIIFGLQHKLTDKQNDLIRAKTLPRASLFLQGGYGRPGLNMLKNNFDWYGMGGLRFSWPIANLYTKRNDKQQVEVNRQQLSLEEEKYDIQTQAAIRQQRTEIVKWQSLLLKDREIIRMRQFIKAAAAAQLEEGVMTSNDYLREVNAEDQAQQVLKAHEIQLLQAKLQLQLLTGKTTIHE
jgi:outer membrane protein TolC